MVLIKNKFNGGSSSIHPKRKTKPTNLSNDRALRMTI
jgi:hypothetical protein